ncbi:hypothetical protein K439DRAFT_1639375 [Ramaria rubella]|nr:hypothetical protein K439DRAFT_1639375 [Ramaria rubella]
MPFRHISSDLKQSSLSLLDSRYTPAETCEIMAVSHSSLCRWVNNYAEYGDVIKHDPNQG